METPASPLHAITAPFAIHALNVGGGHTLYVEESGNPNGLPALFLHGGPGAGTQPEHRGYFDPAVYHIVLFDQRGCGQSTSPDPLHANTTQHLLADIETIRTHLHIARWHVVAGWSWGAALGLLYAEEHAERLTSLVLSSTFLANEAALAQMFSPVAIAHAPQAYAEFEAVLPNPTTERINAALQGPQAQAVALAWALFDCAVMEPAPDIETIRAYLAENPAAILHGSRLMSHYMSHRCFLEENQILANIQKLQGKPVFISHGTEDLCCLPTASESLKAALPQAVYTAVRGAGHRSTDALKAQRAAHLRAAARLPL